MSSKPASARVASPVEAKPESPAESRAESQAASAPAASRPRPARKVYLDLINVLAIIFVLALIHI